MRWSWRRRRARAQPHRAPKVVEPDYWDDIEPWGPGRISVTGDQARLHSNAHGDPTRLHTLFVDGPEKLAAPERFAAARFQCGHFFAGDPAGARSEASHYGVDSRDRFLLEVRLELPDVLDLTNYETLSGRLRAMLDAKHTSGKPYEGLLMVIDQNNGGNLGTDDIGTQAFVDGYRGVRFFGARAVSDADLNEMRNTWSIVFGDEEERMCAFLRRKPAVTNLVVFTAANVVRYARAHRIDGGPWRQNELFGASEDDYLRACERDGVPPSSAPDPSSLFRAAPNPDDGFFSTNYERPPRDV